MDNPSIYIFVATHKPYWMPDDEMYIPIQVGAINKDSISGFLRDDEGNNISSKNPRYSELTAMYWAWKNVKADYFGLAHYRRHFSGKGQKGVIAQAEVERYLKEYPVILPKKRHYFIETVGNHYAHTFDQAHLNITRKVLTEVSPEILPFYDAHLKSRSAHIWNMAIMRNDIFQAWCSWLFPVLEEIEKHIQFDNMTPFQERVIGRISERLLDPWLEVNGIPYVEISVTSLDGENWAKKIWSFLRAKFTGKGYEKSF